MRNSESAQAMVDRARAFLQRLDESQRQDATAAMEDETGRSDWNYVPRQRPGLAFTAMGAPQQKAAYELVACGLSLAAFAAVTTIIGLEDVLDESENKVGPRRFRSDEARPWGRHRADYSMTVFGQPGDEAPWGWRFEGHHVSINVTVVDGEISATPLFLGANPAEVRNQTGHVVTRPLAGEEDVALALVEALDERRDEAVIGADAPDDILTAAAPRLDDPPEVAGVRLADLTGTAAAAGETLVRLYIERLAPAVARRRWDVLRPQIGDVRFAFAGQAKHGCPQYYRLAGPSFFVEYDNTQNGANHVHTVVRDPEGDFGGDLLRAHRAEHHSSLR